MPSLPGGGTTKKKDADSQKVKEEQVERSRPFERLNKSEGVIIELN